MKDTILKTIKQALKIELVGSNMPDFVDVRSDEIALVYVRPNRTEIITIMIKSTVIGDGNVTSK